MVPLYPWVSHAQMAIHILDFLLLKLLCEEPRKALPCVLLREFYYCMTWLRQQPRRDMVRVMQENNLLHTPPIVFTTDITFRAKKCTVVCSLLLLHYFYSILI